MSSYLGGTSGVRRRIHLGVLSAIVGVAVALAGLLFTDGLPSGSVYDPAPVTILAILLASFVTLYPFIRNLLYEEDILEPSVVIGGLLFAYFPLRAFGISVLGSSPAFPSFRAAAHVSLTAFTLGLIVISGGAVAVYAGYRLSLAIGTAETWPALAGRRLLITNVVVIWLASVGVHLLGSFGLVPTGNAILYHVSTWHFLVALVVLAGYYRSGGTAISPWLVLVILAVEAAVLTVAGFDLNSVLMLLTFSILAYHYVGPGITTRKLIAAGGSIVVLFPVSEIAEDVQAGQDLAQAFGQGGAGVLWYVDAFVGRMIGTDALTMIVTRTPDPVPYQGGETLLLAVYGLVPRAVWPGKPSLIMCGVNNQYFSGRGEAANTCAAMTVPGELYWNFGAAGVVVGLFVVGLLLGGVYRWFRYGNGGPKNYVHLVIYALVLLQVMRFESGVGQLVSNLIKGVAFAAVFLWFVTEPRGDDSFVLEGDSAFERSRLSRVGQSVVHAIASAPIPASATLNRVGRSILATPRRTAVTVEASQVGVYARSLDRVVKASWTDALSKLRTAWRVSGVRRIVEGSKTEQLLRTVR